MHLAGILGIVMLLKSFWLRYLSLAGAAAAETAVRASLILGREAAVRMPSCLPEHSKLLIPSTSSLALHG